MATREDLHRLIDRLPESECSTAFGLLEDWLTSYDPMLLTLLNAPEDDEPTTPEENESARQAREAYYRGEYITADEAKRKYLA